MFCVGFLFHIFIGNFFFSDFEDITKSKAKVKKNVTQFNPIGIDISLNIQATS